MLHIIPTPIWNTDDITLRALKLFKELKYFICEDTRTFKKLLSIYEIEYKDKEFFSLTSFTNPSKIKHYENIIRENEVGLVSEAGTPWLSDPWKILIKICTENNIQFSVLPWANALVPSIVWAWFDTSKFTFLWFLPQKKGRQTILKSLVKNPLIKGGKEGSNSTPTFFYESVHRIEKLLKELEALEFQGQIFIWRELSKKFEQYETWSLAQIQTKFQNGEIQTKWEFVVWLF